MYGSSGDFGPAFLSAVDMKTGRIAWQDRTFSRAHLLYADGKLILLDEDGTLYLQRSVVRNSVNLGSCRHFVSRSRLLSS